MHGRREICSLWIAKGARWIIGSLRRAISIPRYFGCAARELCPAHKSRHFSKCRWQSPFKCSSHAALRVGRSFSPSWQPCVREKRPVPPKHQGGQSATRTSDGADIGTNLHRIAGRKYVYVLSRWCDALRDWVHKVERESGP